MSMRATPFSLTVEGREYSGHWCSDGVRLKVLALFGAKSAPIRGREGAEAEVAADLLRDLVRLGLA